jgi:hypothetical protein
MSSQVGYHFCEPRPDAIENKSGRRPEEVDLARGSDQGTRFGLRFHYDPCTLNLASAIAGIQEKRDIANIDDCQSLTRRCSGHPGRGALNFALSGGRSAVDIKVLDPPEGHVIARGSYLGGPDYEFVVWHDGQVYSASRSPVREVEALKSRPTCRRTTSRPWVGSRSRSHAPRP